MMKFKKAKQMIISVLIFSVVACSFMASALVVNGYHFFTDYTSTRTFGSLEFSKIAYAGKRYSEYSYSGLANNDKKHDQMLYGRVYTGTSRSGKLISKGNKVYGNTGPNVMKYSNDYAKVGQVISIYAKRKPAGEKNHQTICYFN